MWRSSLLSQVDQTIGWQLNTHGRRPTMAEVAGAMELSAAQLRRRFKSAGELTFRSALTQACLTHAGMLIRNGTKIEAAMRLAGFRNKTNFNKQFNRRFGALPNQCRDNNVSKHQSTVPIWSLSVPENARAIGRSTLD
jgi:methylphosphotriester-DNA--protein-cysteine methyltransferase